MTRQREGRRAKGFLQRPLPVAAHHERMIIIQVIIHADDRRAIIRLAVSRNRRNRKRNAVRADDVPKAVRGVRLHTEALEREWISRGDGLQRIEAAPELYRTEVEELVRND